MLLLGIDLGTSSIKVSVVDAATGMAVASVQYPDKERDITSLQPGYAEQSPLQWWNDIAHAIMKANATKKYDPKDIAAIGIAYQMHGLVCIDKNKQVLRDSIIWCDSRAVEIGNKAFSSIGEEKCLSHLLNSPGNFTASKLAWVKENEPELYATIDKILLPGDFIAMQLTGEISTTISALSEGIFWDFKKNEISKDVLDYFSFDRSIIPAIKNVFEEHGKLVVGIANELGLVPGIPVTYKAGDQPNNALSLNVLESGEVAATAGTSGVIYAVGDTLSFDTQSRVNSFAHVNHTAEHTRIGTLLCINGCGSMYRFVKEHYGNNSISYNEMNEAAGKIKIGSEGLAILPFCNGAERMLNNKILGADKPHNNKYSAAQIYRATQEGIAFAFRYGLDIMRSNNIEPSVIRAGKSNMFLSDIFIDAFVNATKVPVELYNCDGSVGAAIGAGIGANIFTDAKEAFVNFKPISIITPDKNEVYNDLYFQWKEHLDKTWYFYFILSL